LRDDVQKGVAYIAYWNDLYLEESADESLTILASTGANWISLLVTQKQKDVKSTEIVPVKATPTDESLIHAIEDAHRLGLKVMLKPHIGLSEDKKHWRGEIGEKFETEEEWQAWFASYTDMILHYAEMARDNDVEQFCVGTELEGTVHRSEDWRRVIREVRKLYSGPVVYASNQIKEDNYIDWWDAVDYIGVDAYYRLSKKPKPRLRDLIEGWQPHLAVLEGLSLQYGKKIILTEIGYRSAEGIAARPWDWQREAEVNLAEQELCYRAAFEVFHDKEWFGGMYWWSWETKPDQGGENDPGYSPHNKPAEKILMDWYGGAGRP